MTQYTLALHAAVGGVPGNSPADAYFALTPPMEQALRQVLLESIDFLGMVTSSDVDQMQGQVVDVGASALFTGRKAAGRFIRPITVDGNQYALKETDSGVALPWDLLSIWANAGGNEQFMQLVNAFTTQAFALDMLRIGWNGTSAAATTDYTTNPLGEDVNKGWHQIAKEFNGGAQIISTAVTLGAGGDYVSLDAMAADLINTKIPAEFRDDPRLTVLVGADLVAAEQFRLYQAADKPTEKIAAQLLANSIAGRKAIIPPFMPGKRLVVTIPANLQILTQRNTRQRKVEFVEDRKQYENKYLRNEGYALGYRELYAAIDESAVTIGTGE
ncbi:phage major capsid protein, P2 family [Enterobacteriales bacterium SAP-6]|uniref:Phage major capsid protein, P2 family n=2 Tax=Acerihabitans arboris TaxID=2691583 RepID=A0A845SV22_9GAMM|nr:phage major capsid protein, P2 family [Acerihabitans arboris]